MNVCSVVIRESRRAEVGLCVCNVFYHACYL